MSHTPGPWMVHAEDRRAVVDSGGVCVVADVRSYRDTDDARLIAAAPDLLAALKAVLAEEMIYTGAIIETLEASGLHCELFDKICAAIAKAEGHD
jgi:hypothetical protein